MIKKSKKCLALILSVASVSSFMGNFGAVAMDPSPAAAAASAPRGSAWSNPLALQALRHQSDTGITEEDLEKPWVRHAFEIYGNLMKRKLKYKKVVGKKLERLGKKCKSLRELYKQDVDYNKRNGEGICRTFAHRVIYEFLEKSKKVGEHVEIYPLTLHLCDGSSHNVAVFIVDGKKFVMDISTAVKAPREFPYIFTLENYLKYYSSHYLKVTNCAVIFEDVSTCEKPLKDSCLVGLDPNTGKGYRFVAPEGETNFQKYSEAVITWF